MHVLLRLASTVNQAAAAAREHDVGTRCGINYTSPTRTTTANANMAITLHFHDSPNKHEPEHGDYITPPWQPNINTNWNMHATP